MNTKNFIKKILTKSIIGFPIGVTFLMLLYVIVNPFFGEVAFSYELNRLHNIQTFILQLLLSGLSGFMLLIAFYSILFLQDAELENRFATEHPYRAIFYAIVSVLITFIIIMVISRANIFSTTISILIEIVYPVLYAVLGFVLLIKDSIMKYTINKINKKLQ